MAVLSRETLIYQTHYSGSLEVVEQTKVAISLSVSCGGKNRGIHHSGSVGRRMKWRVEGRHDVAARTMFNFDRVIEVEDKVNDIVIIPHCSERRVR